MRQHGRRATHLRLLLAILADADHLPLDTLLRQLRQRTSVAFDATIYRVLERLIDVGLVFKIDLGTGDRYGVVCEQCWSLPEVAGVRASGRQYLSSAAAPRYLRS